MMNILPKEPITKSCTEPLSCGTLQYGCCSKGGGLMAAQTMCAAKNIPAISWSNAKRFNLFLIVYLVFSTCLAWAQATDCDRIFGDSCTVHDKTL